MKTIVLEEKNEAALKVEIDHYFGRFPSAGYGTSLIEKSSGMKDGKPIVWCKITRSDSCE